ncbi:MAG: ribosomal RNA small subunit methyltransferase A [Candidatus Pacebacteria bacterium]|nr:ribosomal RNA small subunit methyltransferase A [Candidatus Paceibacterota bacterium]
MRQKFGQHFLKNQNAVKKIIEKLGIKTGEKIVEIGPGEGALTHPLMQEIKNNNAEFLGIEKDLMLAEKLKNEGINVVAADALEEIPKINTELKDWKLCGNIPYYISGFLFRTISELENRPKKIILMIQKEVAERITAIPPDMNLLAASIQVWGTPKIIFRLKPEDFSPKPEVDSAIIEINLNENQLTADELKKYYETAKALFKQPRKTIFNNLREHFENQDKIKIILESLDIKPDKRGQDLSIEQMTKISKEI